MHESKPLNSIEKKIREILRAASIKYEILEHKPVYTNPEQAECLDVPLRATVKSLVVKMDKKWFCVAVLSGDKRLDIRRLAKATGGRRPSLAKPKEIETILGI